MYDTNIEDMDTSDDIEIKYIYTDSDIDNNYKICSPKGKLCGRLKCTSCSDRSIASEPEIYPYNPNDPHNKGKPALKIAKTCSHTKYDIRCNKCGHLRYILPGNINKKNDKK